MLALASYNSGEQGVQRALQKVGQEPGGFSRDKRDFWHLYRRKLLSQETSEYVPSVLAAAIVGSHPQRYGLAPGRRISFAARSAETRAWSGLARFLRATGATISSPPPHLHAAHKSRPVPASLAVAL